MFCRLLATQVGSTHARKWATEAQVASSRAGAHRSHSKTQEALVERGRGASELCRVAAATPAAKAVSAPLATRAGGGDPSNSEQVPRGVRLAIFGTHHKTGTVLMGQA